MLVKMGADIEGIGSNVLTVNGAAEPARLRPHDRARPHRDRLVHGARRRHRRRAAHPRHDPGDLRMIRLVFERARPAARSSTATTSSCPATRTSSIARDVGEHKITVQDGPWPAFPADLTSIAVALATQCAGSVLIHEWMFENRMIFTDKLVLDGRRHHALRPAPRDRHRARRGCAASASSRRTSAPGWRC